MQEFRAIITEKIFHCPNILELQITLATPETITFKPGQFINLLHYKDGVRIRRSYSICSSTTPSATMNICVKYLPDGIVSRYLAQAPIGTELFFEGPQGFFGIKNPDVPMRMIATGTGIAPFMAMIEGMDMNTKSVHPGDVRREQEKDPASSPHREDGRDVGMLFGVRSEAEIFWLDRLEQLRMKSSWFSYSLTLSQPSPTWTGLLGRVTAHIKEVLHPNPETQYYICGSPPMVLDVRRQLIENTIDPKKIYFELFT